MVVRHRWRLGRPDLLVALAVAAVPVGTALRQEAVLGVGLDVERGRPTSSRRPPVFAELQVNSSFVDVDPMIRFGSWLLATGSEVSGAKAWVDSATWGNELAKWDSGLLDESWKRMEESAKVTPDDVRKLTTDPEQAKELLMALVSVLMMRTEMGTRCSRNWLQQTGKAWSMAQNHAIEAYEGSLNTVRAEMTDVVARTVKVVEQVADVIAEVVLRAACEFLIHVGTQHTEEQRKAECAKDGAELLTLIQALEFPTWRESREHLVSLGIVDAGEASVQVTAMDSVLFRWGKPPLSGKKPGRLPKWRRMRSLVSRDETSKALARKIVDFASVLSSGLLAASQSADPAVSSQLVAFIAPLREKLWRCGQLSTASTPCNNEHKVGVPMPANNENTRSKQHVTPVFGSQLITALLVYWPEKEAYDRKENCGLMGQWFCERAGTPGGLGVVAGVTDVADLQMRLRYWDPAINIVDWAKEMCEHQQHKSGGKNCVELQRMLTDVSSFVHLGTVLTAGSIFIGQELAVGGAAAFSVAALPHTLGGAILAAHHGGGVLAAATAVFGTAVAAPLVAGLALGSLVGSATWVVYRMFGADSALMVEEDCMCGMLSTVTRPVIENGRLVPNKTLPTRAQIGIGYDVCTTGLGACPTKQLLQARRAVDTVLASLDELVVDSACRSAQQPCQSKAEQSFCELESLLSEGSELCKANTECDGTVMALDDEDEPLDGRRIFNQMCEHWHDKTLKSQTKARTVFATINARLPQDCID